MLLVALVAVVHGVIHLVLFATYLFIALVS